MKKIASSLSSSAAAGPSLPLPAIGRYFDDGYLGQRDRPATRSDRARKR